MRLRRLILEQFRSYRAQTIDFPVQEDVHLLVGPNGAGKTNVLEAIAVLSLTKSCQGLEDSDLLHWGHAFYRVRGEALSDTGDLCTLEVVNQEAPRRQKACFLNDVRVPVSALVGMLPTVIFLPRDLELLGGAPQHRRSFLDILLCQVSPEYLVDLSQYQKILKQRNALLRRIREGEARPDDLTLWDRTLAAVGARITCRRLELIEMLQCTLPEEFSSLGEAWEDVQLIYDRKGAARTVEDIASELMDLLRAQRDRDIILCTTSAGPHRDDWRIDVAGRPLTSFASRGQQRTAIVALLFLQVSYLELRRGEKPVILLDDVFSELDDRHQAALLQSLSGHQVIITSTHVPEGTRDIAMYRVEEGAVVQNEQCAMEHS